MENTCEKCGTPVVDKCDVCWDNHLCEQWHEYQSYKTMFDQLDNDEDAEP